jgi:hypothetical protein
VGEGVGEHGDALLLPRPHIHCRGGGREGGREGRYHDKYPLAFSTLP